MPSFLLLMMMSIMGAMLMSDYLSMKHTADNAARVVDSDTKKLDDENKTILIKSTALLVCKDLELTEGVVQKDGADTDFVQVEATAEVKIPFVRKYFLETLTVYSAPEYKG